MDPSEVVVLVGIDAIGQEVPLYVHVPTQPSVAAVPDSPDLWAVIWSLRDRLVGIAHTHPPGAMEPSSQDLATVRGVERALGRTIFWWILDPCTLRAVRFAPAGERGYTLVPLNGLSPTWAHLASVHALNARTRRA